MRKHKYYLPQTRREKINFIHDIMHGKSSLGSTREKIIVCYVWKSDPNDPDYVICTNHRDEQGNPLGKVNKSAHKNGS